ncbi:hypothetical protein [Rhodanobacter thiooxydans]|jgi:hypothetical protein|uniref:hypothetical protein n=1 Tax=Rhodanobacter thiooxydans TaxID=416169 RepID=UPI000D3A587E|nr:hypothetical protein [Rhodanobacter thiooxydans]
MNAQSFDLAPPDAVVTPGLIEAAERGEPGADARALRHCDAWLASGQPLPPALRDWMYRRAWAIVGNAMIVEVGP